MITKELADELKAKYNPEGSTLRVAQLRMVEMLKFIDSVCKEHDLNYWLSFGTLLGAARHGGFIPWDDDTDICMPIEDLRKFKEIMLNNNPSDEFVLQCHETDPNYNRSEWVVLRDLMSEYIQGNRFHNELKYRGVQVDIFPVEENLSYWLKSIVDSIQRFFITTPTLSDRWVCLLLRPFRNFFWNLLNHILIPVCRLHKNKGNRDIYNVSYGVIIPYKFVGNKNDIYPFKRMLFENTELNVPHKYDKYLTNLYGDWMNIPTSSNIKTHEVEVIFK